MEPAELRQKLAEFADDALTGAERNAIAAQVEQDPALQAEVARWRALRAAGRRAIEAEQTPPGLADRIRAEIRKPTQTGRRPPKLWWLAASAAAAILVAILVWPGGSAPCSTSANEFWQRHLMCLAAPESDQLAVHNLTPAEAEDKLRRQFGFDVVMPDLSDRGWRLAGAMECHVNTSTGPATVIHAFYRPADDREAISFFSLAKPTVLDNGCQVGERQMGEMLLQETIARTKQGEFAILAWHTRRTGYAACGKLPAEQLRSLVVEAARYAQRPSAQPMLAAQP